MSDISNRQIFVDEAISVLIWVAIALPLAVLPWWMNVFPVPGRFQPDLQGSLALALLQSSVSSNCVAMPKGSNGQKRK